MGSYFRQLVLSGVTAKRRKFELLAASCLVPLSLGLSEPAVAQTCTPVDTPGTLTAAFPSTSCTGTFNTNINFGGPTTPPPPPPGLTVTLQPGVQVIIPAGSAITDSVNLANTTGAIGTPGVDANLTANSAFIDNTANSSAANKSGLRIQASGNATITATDTAVNVVGTQSTNAIWAIVLPSSDPNALARVSHNGPGLTSFGTAFSTAIQADNRGAGPAVIDAAGNMTGVALGAAANGITGLFASGGSSATVNYTSGTIDVRG